jgi:hypothetical protein
VVPGTDQFEIAVSYNNSLKYFAEIFIIALQYLLTFILIEHVAFTVLLI